MSDDLKEIMREVLKEELQPVNSQLEQISGRLENVETNQQQVKQAVLETNDIVKRNSEDISTVKRAVLETSENVNQMKKIMITKDDMSYIDQKISEYGREIFKFKQRSI